MTTQSNTARWTHPTTSDRFAHAIAMATNLDRAIRATLLTDRDVHMLQRALDGIPVASDEYDWLQARVCNAQVYCQQREYCAASYELTLAVNRLRSRAQLWHGADANESFF
jgi:hypothetical protein